MCEVSAIPGLADLWRQTLGDDRICVAVVDGPVDDGHPALTGAKLTSLNGVWPRPGPDDPAAAHGTLVTSVIFGQHGGPVTGVAPRCRGLSVPAFSSARPGTSQLDLARGIELAVDAGADVINVSGGQLSPTGTAEDVLARAVRLCERRNVLLVAAAGNDGCLCEHVPAALPSVIAVGALDDEGAPMAMSNWGRAYREQGLLAPGENIRGAVPGGGTARRTGTSLAAPIVAGVAALLLSLQLRSGRQPDPLSVRAALLDNADACDLDDPEACAHFLTGKLNIERAVRAVTMQEIQLSDTAEKSESESCGCTSTDAGVVVPAGLADAPAAERPDRTIPIVSVIPPPPTIPVPAPATPAAVVPSAESPAEPEGRLVYALGTLGYDFGTEARRDSFKQLMQQMPPPTPVVPDTITLPPNPYDARQIVQYLTWRPSEAKSLIWTVSLDLTPIYAVEGVGPYGTSVYAELVKLLGLTVDSILSPQGDLDHDVDAAGDAADRAQEQAQEAVGATELPDAVEAVRVTLAGLRKALQHAKNAYDIAKAAVEKAEDEDDGGDVLRDAAAKWTRAKEKSDEIEKGIPNLKSLKAAGEAAQAAAAAAKLAVKVAILASQVLDQVPGTKIERIAVPGRLSGRTAKLFSGQVVPVVELDSTRGLVGWDVRRLTAAALRAVRSADNEVVAWGAERKARQALRDFLNRIYYDLRNLGTTSADRALNASATEAFGPAGVIRAALGRGLSMDSIGVEKSPYGRVDGDNWDIKLRFFNPDNTRQARTVFRFTVDVSDVLPVLVGQPRSWSES
jgi:hypothetical protein